jgi:hypothetical protein
LSQHFEALRAFVKNEIREQQSIAAAGAAESCEQYEVREGERERERESGREERREKRREKREERRERERYCYRQLTSSRQGGDRDV